MTRTDRREPARLHLLEVGMPDEAAQEILRRYFEPTVDELAELRIPAELLGPGHEVTRAKAEASARGFRKRRGRGDA